MLQYMILVRHLIYIIEVQSSSSTEVNAELETLYKIWFCYFFQFSCMTEKEVTEYYLSTKSPCGQPSIFEDEFIASMIRTEMAVLYHNLSGFDLISRNWCS
jgi:hypothetical protein